MERYNKGLIFTNDNCIACNKCISFCPVFGANVFTSSGETTKIQIDSRKCDNCGSCVVTCLHKAREYKDDTQAFFEALKSGEKISVIFESSFFLLYKDSVSKITGYLKSLGVDKVYDSTIGTEISIWAHAKYLKENDKGDMIHRSYIANTCAATVNNLKRTRQFLRRKVIPVQSPVMCAATYVHKYLNDTNKIAVIGPCIARNEEKNWEGLEGKINYTLTFKNFMEAIPLYDISKFHGSVDLSSTGLCDFLPVRLSFSEVISLFFPKNRTVLRLYGLKNENFNHLETFIDKRYLQYQPLISEVSACSEDCISGPGIDSSAFDKGYIYSCQSEQRRLAFNKIEAFSEPEIFWQKVSQAYSSLDSSDFACKISDLTHQPYHVPKSAYDEIFADMLKDTVKKQTINCGSCGYNSCREMARAIACGYSRKENCIHYMNDEFTKRLVTDNETGLYNRQAIIQKGNTWRYENTDKQLLIAVCDINKHKVINDLYGYESGVKVVKFIGKHLSQVTGSSGFCGRLGFGTFVICQEYTVENLQKLQMIKAFDCSSLGIYVPVTLRFGLYILEGVEDLSDAINKASICMDNKSSSVKNTFEMYSPSLLEKNKQETRIAGQFQSALNNKEFEIWFQPQYSAASGELVGAEALCRWHKPDGQIISPTTFIPIAEKDGFIRVLDNEIWRMGFNYIRDWLDKGLEPVPISLNISRVSLESDALIYNIMHLKSEFKIPEKYIHFEITESAYMSSQEDFIHRIERIRNMGYQIAMDDFGSGYSSLNTLKDIPLDILKLDMGFVQGKKNKDKGGVILSSIAGLAQKLQLVTIAEGVESKEQADFLRSIGINIIQGFLYDKALTENKFLALLRKFKRKKLIQKPAFTGNLDIQKLFDISSSENTMFEEMMGPAIVINYNDKNNELSMLRANEKALKILGVEELSFIEAKSALLKYVPKKIISSFIKGIKDAINSEKETVLYNEYINLRRDVPIWIRSHVWQISKVENNHSLVVILEDVSTEKIAETALELSNSQFKFMFDKSQIGMCLLHVSYDIRHINQSLKIRILKTNESFLKMTGFSESDVLSWTEKDAFSVIHPDDRLDFMAKSMKFFLRKSKEAFSQEYRALVSSGEYVKVRIYVNGLQQPDKSWLLITNYVVLGNS